MALMMDVELENGITVENSYMRISELTGNKESIKLTVKTYLSQEAYLGSKAPIETRLYVFTPSVDEGSENFIRQAYLYLKSLPEYASAKDC